MAKEAFPRLLRDRYALYDRPDDGGAPEGNVISVLTRADASALNLSQVDDGSTVYVSDAPALFRLDKSDTTSTVDGVEVLAASPSGRLIREQVPILRYVRQTAWYVDPAAGDDEADGLTANTAIKTRREWFARTLGEYQGSPTMHLNAAIMPATDRFHYSLLPRDPAATTAVFTMIGLQTQVAVGALTAAATNPVNTAGGETATITDAARLWVADQLVIFANGAQCFVLADLGAGVAETTPFCDINGVAVAAPPNGNAYTIYTLTQDSIATVASGDDVLIIQDIQVTSGPRSANRILWKRCLFKTGLPSILTSGFFIGCLVSVGQTINLSRGVNGEQWFPCLKFAMCGFLNSPVQLFDGFVYFESVVCKNGGVTVGVPASSVVTPAGGQAVLTIAGTWGLGILNSATGGLDVAGDSTVFVGGLTLQLWGKGNATFGTRLPTHGGAKVRVSSAATPTLASTGTELSFPANPIPALAAGAAVPAQAACATWAAWAAAPFQRFAQSLDLQTSVAGA